MSGTPACKPAGESVTDAAGVAACDERASKVHARRYFDLADDAGGELGSGQAALALQSLAHLGDARGTTLADDRELCGKISIGRIETEPDHVQRLPVPGA